MARIIGGIGASHSPTIAFGKDANKASDPNWAPIFEGFAAVRDWLIEKKADVVFMIYNDHVTSFFFDHYSAFALGVDSSYKPADEGGGARPYPPIPGHLGLSQHIGRALMADSFDMSFFQNKGLDHGCFSPLSMIAMDENGWKGSIVPLQVGVLQFPIPNARRCYDLGRSLRKAIQSYPEDLNVAVVATGGLSHQVHGERCGFNNTEWDNRFLDLLENNPEALTEMRLAEYATEGGMEGAEVIMWLIMRGALSADVKCVHRQTYLPSMTNIATLVLEDLGDQPSAEDVAAWNAQSGHELAGAEKLEGTYPFDFSVSQRAWRINDFLHRLIEPAHRERFVNDQEALFEEFGLAEEERAMIRERRWIDLIRYGVIFFLLEKMGAVIGVGNIDIYASMRGQSVEEFQKTRNVSMKYSVAAQK
ncbi:gallate dioxygenase [Parathalassolituus penaei]|uniref:Gallate dioxygenase n=1 Tax=Parathalassolituus penaei TaxID=2997323 RepID=A0A9X3EL40_9GAMM|nr:gallate dioxygenase [Parathalassolituus penaei]MCY0966346.1 gallate dioxygenase [Parathalassolituus penaei]